jgi:hypothetical protein
MDIFSLALPLVLFTILIPLWGIRTWRAMGILALLFGLLQGLRWQIPLIISEWREGALFAAIASCVVTGLIFTSVYFGIGSLILWIRGRPQVKGDSAAGPM